MKILILNQEEMKKIMDMKGAISAVRDAASEYSSGNANIPLRANLDVKEYSGNSLYMYGYVTKLNALGVKLVSVYPNNPKLGVSACPATVVLEKAETGEVKAIMDGTYLTRLRTGALSGAATDILARKDAKVYAQVGIGGQAECQLLAVLAVRNIEEVIIVARDKIKVEKFCDDMKAKLKSILSENYATKQIPKFTSCFDNGNKINTADIITCVTTANDPVFDFEDVKKGCHINGVGSYTPTMSEIPEGVVVNAKTIIVDTMDGTINETGDFLKTMAKGLFKKEMITGELGTLVDNKCHGRLNEDDITFFETTGSSVFDLVTGEKIYQEAINKKMGQFIEL